MSSARRLSRSQHRPIKPGARRPLYVGLTLPVIRSTGKKHGTPGRRTGINSQLLLGKAFPSFPEQHSSRWSLQPLHHSHVQSSSLHYPQWSSYYVRTCIWDEEAQALLDEYEKSGDPDIADQLIESLDAARRARWEESTARMNFTHSSRKSWALLRRLGAAQRP